MGDNNNRNNYTNVECTSHEDCGGGSWCSFGGSCRPCSLECFDCSYDCFLEQEPIDGICPEKCCGVVANHRPDLKDDKIYQNFDNGTTDWHDIPRAFPEIFTWRGVTCDPTEELYMYLWTGKREGAMAIDFEYFGEACSRNRLPQVPGANYSTFAFLCGSDDHCKPGYQSLAMVSRTEFGFGFPKFVNDTMYPVSAKAFTQQPKCRYMIAKTKRKSAGGIIAVILLFCLLGCVWLCRRCGSGR